MTREQFDKAVEAVALAIWEDVLGPLRYGLDTWAQAPEATKDSVRGDARVLVVAAFTAADIRPAGGGSW